MINSTGNCLLADREEFSEEEKELFLSDLKETCEEYFEGSDRFSINITKTPSGYSVCILYNARRIKSFKKPQ
jgi:hypothetical protein